MDPRLIVIESWGDLPLKARCSACPDVIFDAGALIGNQHQQEIKLVAMFTVHCNQQHSTPQAQLIMLPIHKLKTG